MKKILLIIICLILSVSLSGGIVFAINLVPLGGWELQKSFSVYNGDQNYIKYTLGELEHKYRNSSPEYKKIDISFQLNSLNLSLIDTQIINQDDTIDNYQQLIVQNNALAETYRVEMESYAEGTPEWNTARSNMEACLLNVTTYTAYLANATTQKAEYYTQRENYGFINSNSELLRVQDQIKQLGAFKEKCLSLIILDINKYVADCSVDYNSILLQINKTNLSKGRSTQIDVDYQEASLELAQSQRNSITSNINNTFKDIMRNTGINEAQNTELAIDIKGFLASSIKGYETVKNSFIQNDIKEKQLSENIIILDGRIDILDNTYAADSTVITLENKKKEISVLELEQWRIERLNLLNNIYSNYENKYNQVEIKEDSTRAQYQKYIIALNKFNLGLISRLEMQEERLRFSQSELDAWMALFDYVKALNVIDLAMLGLV